MASTEILDPRIKVELDRLNSTSAEINRLEREIDDIRHRFRHVLTESSQRLTETGKKCIKAIHKAHPYHEAKKSERLAHESAQDAALKYQRAVSMFRAAKETISIAEEASMQGTNKKRDFDSALQEMLNHATIKLNAAEKDKIQTEKEHQDRSRKYIAAQKRVDQLSKKLRKSIAKSGHYFELRESFYFRLEGMKNRVEALQRQVATEKKYYRQALKSLERISEEIHQSRQLEAILAEERSRGVGAESEPSDSEVEDEARKLSLTNLNLDGDITGQKLFSQNQDGDADLKMSLRPNEGACAMPDDLSLGPSDGACAMTDDTQFLSLPYDTSQEDFSREGVGEFKPFGDDIPNTATMRSGPADGACALSEIIASALLSANEDEVNQDGACALSETIAPASLSTNEDEVNPVEASMTKRQSPCDGADLVPSGKSVSPPALDAAEEQEMDAKQEDRSGNQYVACHDVDDGPMTDDTTGRRGSTNGVNGNISTDALLSSDDIVGGNTVVKAAQKDLKDLIDSTLAQKEDQDILKSKSVAGTLGLVTGHGDIDLEQVPSTKGEDKPSSSGCQDHQDETGQVEGDLDVNDNHVVNEQDPFQAEAVLATTTLMLVEQIPRVGPMEDNRGNLCVSDGEDTLEQCESIPQPPVASDAVSDEETSIEL